MSLFENPIGIDGFEFIQRKRDEGFGEGNFTACSKASNAISCGAGP